jgi:putative addiction module CopG family antidote
MKSPGQMSVTLTPELEKLVRDEVAGGRYVSNSEVIRDALRERYKAKKLHDLDAAIDRGIADIAAGRSMPAAQAFSHIRTALGIKGKAKDKAKTKRQ